MRITIFANCQGQVVKDLILRIRPQYDVTILTNYELIGNLAAGEDVLASFRSLNNSIFIYQPLDDKHGCLSTSVLDAKDDCLPVNLRPVGNGGEGGHYYSTEQFMQDQTVGTIVKHLGLQSLSFPYIYNSALWPFYYETNKYKHSEPLVELVGSLNKREILFRYMQGEIDFRYPQRMQYSMARLADSERRLDVKVEDFIRRNLETRQCFFTQNHPATFVMVEVVRQILRFLGVPLQPSELLELSMFSQLVPCHSLFPGWYPHDISSFEFYKASYMKANRFLHSLEYWSKQIAKLYDLTAERALLKD